ncbi:unnamed protein product [Alopecurus aequalis]
MGNSQQSRPRRRSSQPPGGVDHISALPDDLILLILAGLGCTATAARTSSLSRRWRGLWARLGDISLHDVPFQWVADVLSLVARSPPPASSLIEIHLPRERWPDHEDVASLLRVAARLGPERLHLEFPETGSSQNPIDVQLPCFHRATLVVLESLPFVLRVPAAAGGVFAALRTLLLLDCIVVDKDLAALLSCCPRLRVLVLRQKATDWLNDHRWIITVHSETLQELVMDFEKTWVSGVDIVAPVLKQLTLSFRAYEEASISISAPMLEKVSWCCHYVPGDIGFGLWTLTRLRLQTAQRQEELPSLRIHVSNSSYHFSDEEASLAEEIEKHMFLDISALELHLSTMGHVFGAFVMHLLEMNRVGSVIRRLKIVRQSSQEKEACLDNCPCEPTDWRTQIISLTALEELEIYGFQGQDHEYDLLKLILSCAPMLKKMTMKLSREVSSSNNARTKIFALTAYSSLDCLVFLG